MEISKIAELVDWCFPLAKIGGETINFYLLVLPKAFPILAYPYSITKEVPMATSITSR